MSVNPHFPLLKSQDEIDAEVRMALADSWLLWATNILRAFAVSVILGACLRAGGVL